MRKLSYAVAGAAALALVAGPAFAQGTPSSKAAFTFNDINILEALTFDLLNAAVIEDVTLTPGIGTHDGDTVCQSLRLAINTLNTNGEDE